MDSEKTRSEKQQEYAKRTNYAANKKHLTEKKHNLRVWVDKEKYETFKALADKNGESVYFLVNQMIDEYIETHKPAE